MTNVDYYIWIIIYCLNLVAVALALGLITEKASNVFSLNRVSCFAAGAY